MKNEMKKEKSNGKTYFTVKIYSEMKKQVTYVIGVDEAGEKARGAFARGCLAFLELANRNTGNLNSSCKEAARSYF